MTQRLWARWDVLMYLGFVVSYTCHVALAIW